jgi:hypothetical protein
MTHLGSAGKRVPEPVGTRQIQAQQDLCQRGLPTLPVFRAVPSSPATVNGCDNVQFVLADQLPEIAEHRPAFTSVGPFREFDAAD